MTTNLEKVDQYSAIISNVLLETTPICSDVINIITSYLKPVLKFKCGEAINIDGEHVEYGISRPCICKNSIIERITKRYIIVSYEYLDREQKLMVGLYLDKNGHQYVNKTVAHINKQKKIVRKYVKVYPELSYNL